MVDRLVALNIRSFRELYGLMVDDDFAYAFFHERRRRLNTGHAVLRLASLGARWRPVRGTSPRLSAAAAELADFFMDAGTRQPQDLTGARRQEWASFLKALAAKKVAAAEDATV